jgi:outer membrane protein OmpA-like peptidoglycan-associated protein
MKGPAKLTSAWILSLLLSATWAQNKPANNDAPDCEIRYVPFGQAHDFSLGVQCIVEREGHDPGELDGFDLKVDGSFLGPEKPDIAALKSMAPAELYADEAWFRYHAKNQIRYLRFSGKPSKFDTLKGESWLQERERIQIGGRFLQKLGPNEALGNFVIRSSAKMKRHDVIDLGKFAFQPSHPGMYQIDLRLYRSGGAALPEPQAERDSVLIERQKLCVYFECPDYEPILSLAGADTIQLRNVEYPYIHTPIVNGFFFENTSAPQLTQNATDQLFRALLYGRVITGFPCNTDSIALLVLPDPLYAADQKLGKNYAPTLALSWNRATHVKQMLASLAADYFDSPLCESPVAGNGLRHSHERCQPKLKLQRQVSETTVRKLIKAKDSDDEAKKYRQENRVVALQPAQKDEYRLFEPLTIRQNEAPEYVQLRLHVKNHDRVMDSCLDSGKVVVRDLANDSSKVQKLTEAQLVALRSEEITLSLDQLKQFTAKPGRYEARVALYSKCDSTVRYSQPVEFYIKPQARLLDEIFALSPFDSATFSYDYDVKKRLPAMVETLFQKIIAAASDAGEDAPIQAQVLISGHTDVLSEHRGAFYNLGLSFMRAQMAKQKLQERIFNTARARGFTPGRERAAAFDTATVCFVSKSMRSKMGSPLYAQTITQNFFKSLRALPVKPPELKENYQTIKDDKLRHFRDTEAPQTSTLPSRPYHWAVVNAQIDTIEKNVVCAATTIPMRYGKKRISISLITAGFGAAVPFYRKFVITDTLKAIFCAGGMAPNDFPNAIFADDKYPSGRVMNRRIEVSLIVNKLSAKTNGVSKE